jgi:hypothetical protein
MIRLVLGTNEKIDLTLKEKTTITDPTYLFQFENNSSHEKVYCISQDTSVYPDRYNRFTIIVKTANPVALNGEIKLTTGNEYNYTVYAQSSTTNLDPALADETVEEGYMTYDKSMTQRANYNPSGNTRKVYEK